MMVEVFSIGYLFGYAMGIAIGILIMKVQT